MFDIPQVYEQRVGDNEMIVIEGCSRCLKAHDAAELLLIFEISFEFL